MPNDDIEDELAGLREQSQQAHHPEDGTTPVVIDSDRWNDGSIGDEDPEIAAQTRERDIDAMNRQIQDAQHPEDASQNTVIDIGAGNNTGGSLDPRMAALIEERKAAFEQSQLGIVSGDQQPPDASSDPGDPGTDDPGTGDPGAGDPDAGGGDAGGGGDGGGNN